MILLWKLIKKPKEYKYKVNKIQMPRFINTELKSDSGSSDSDLDSEKVKKWLQMITNKSDSHKWLLIVTNDYK